MKTVIFSLSFLFSLQLQAQQWYGSTNTSSSITREGQVTVGSNQTPISVFQTSDGMSRCNIGPAYYFNYGTSYIGFNAGRTSAGTWILNGDGGNNGGAIISPVVNGAIRFIAIPTSAGAATRTLTDAQVLQHTKMVINADGKVTIGNVPIANASNSLSNYNLFVEKGIITERVKVAVKTTADWSDFVFKDNYKLRPLQEVNTFIQANKHLPDMPSDKEVVADGLDLAQMDAKLLQKVEELTLYAIQLQQENQNTKTYLCVFAVLNLLLIGSLGYFFAKRLNK